MDARDLLVANLDLVERVVAFTCRRSRLEEIEAEDFAATVKLRLVENDYAIIRKFEARSSFSTFLSVVVQRLLLDYRIHAWGKWHPSAAARRLGETAIELEKILHRDGRSLDDAESILRVSRGTLEELAAQLPPRPPRRRVVDLTEAESVAAAPEESSPDRHKKSDQLSRTVRGFIDGLPPDERLIMQLRFDSEMTVAQIARSLSLDPKQLYRHIDKLLNRLRAELEKNGIAAEDAQDILGDRGTILDFKFGNGTARPSKAKEESITNGSEEVLR